MDIDQGRILSVGDVIRHRAVHFLVPFLGLMVLATVVAFSLPVTYDSSVTILVEESDIPEEILETTFTSFVNQRLDELTQIIMSRRVLGEIIGQYDLYRAMREEATIEEVIEKMKGDITFETNSTNVIPQGAGRPMQATLSFTITYKSGSPETAHKVTGELASLYINQNSRKIEKRLDDTTTYLEAKKLDLERDVSSLEKKIAEFKELHINEMPELLDMNIETLRDLETELEGQQAEILNLKERNLELEGNLRKTKPYSQIIQATGEKVMSPEDKLDALRFDYLSKRASMSEKHPDIIALKREISELESVVSRKQRLIDTEKRLTTLEAEYAAMSGRMNPRHPDMVRMSGEIAQVRQEIETLSGELAQQQETATRNPDNPAYIDLQTQLDITNLNIKEAEAKLLRLEARASICRGQVEATPNVEKAYLALTRNYDTLKNEYEDILNMITDAEAAKGIEANQKGERFSILDKATLPEKPSEPNVPLIVMLGLVLSLSVALGCVYLAEFTDESVRTAEEVQSATGLPVLSAIPYIHDEKDRVRARQKKIAALVLGALVLLFAIWGIYNYMMNYT
ncbi:GumC family protein [Thermodesulfobacteriota bacterium]